MIPPQPDTGPGPRCGDQPLQVLSRTSRNPGTSRPQEDAGTPMALAPIPPRLTSLFLPFHSSRSQKAGEAGVWCFCGEKLIVNYRFHQSSEKIAVLDRQLFTQKSGIQPTDKLGKNELKIKL